MVYATERFQVVDHLCRPLIRALCSRKPTWQLDMRIFFRVVVSVITGGASAFVGLMAEIGGGLIAWRLFRGPQGILFAMIVGGITAWAIRRYTKLPAAPAAGALGAMVASYLAIASMEVLPPGSIEWAMKGGAYGAMVGVPIGAALGPIALAYQPPKQ